MDTLLVINAGSSSIKFEVFAAEAAPRRLLRGALAGIGYAPRLSARDAAGALLIARDFAPAEVADAEAAEREIAAWLATHLPGPPVAVGHRVVHGGADFSGPVRLDPAVLAALAKYAPLAPLHQPHNLAPVRLIAARRPGLLQVACFDTAFHHGHAEPVDRFAIPDRLHRAGVRRYGFHGLSYEYIASRLPEAAPALAGARVVVAHLGSGASLCALRAGRSVETTMGFTALDGLPMATRPGRLDAGVVLYLMQGLGMEEEAIVALLYHECGLKGVSGLSGDMRELLASPAPLARVAVDLFAHRIAQEAAALAVTLGGLDGFVFTAGIGENAAPVRAAVIARLGLLGAALDAAANAAGQGCLSPPGAAVAVHVIPTDEEMMIARHTLALLRGAPAS